MAFRLNFNGSVMREGVFVVAAAVVVELINDCFSNDQVENLCVIAMT